MAQADSEADSPVTSLAGWTGGAAAAKRRRPGAAAAGAPGADSDTATGGKLTGS